MFHRFGLEQASRKGLLDKLLHESPAVRPTSAAQLSLMAYQTDYGIYNHSNPTQDRPLAMVALHPKENTFEGGPLLSLIRRYHNFKIKDLGYSLEEFWNLSFPVAMFLFEIAEHDIREKSKAASKVDTDLASELGKL